MLIYVLQWRPSWISDRHIKQIFCKGPSGPYGENVSKFFFSETTWKIETKLPRNDHWKVLYRKFVLYADRKSKMATTAIHRLTLNPIKSCRSRHFEFHIGTKNIEFVEDHPMNIHVQFGFNRICSF
jgi:hypothetical protein